MTDKSFGDHMNRNIVKNPLLSTAVTGLSIEDLTHNAVLIPVSLSQEATKTSDQQIGTQTRNLAHPDYVTSNFPFGDAHSITIPSFLPPNNNTTTLDTQQYLKTEKTNETPCANVSKSFEKTEDDFDVNEYFARLQGTRYVSAPLNVLKEEKNANLEETEGNLEEINLNEPDKQADIHQSLTADIAQNFSQLPTVLPQVASAVFSSFSNMLSMKSREQTPDDIRPSSGYQDVKFQRPELGAVPLMGVSDPEVAREVAPPPKEPPVIGTGSYRITSKKKYAQIPGLKSGDIAQKPIYNPISQPNVSYFVPTSVSYPNIPVENTQNVPNNAFQYHSNIDLTKDKDEEKSVHKLIHPNIDTESVTNYNVTSTLTGQAILEPIVAASRESESNIFAPPEQKAGPKSSVLHSSHGVFQQPTQVPVNTPNTSNTVIIPPPPMFSNFPRRDSQTGIDKSILPPSVARRISSNHPIIKAQATPIASFADNIFVPTTLSDTENVSSVPFSSNTATSESTRFNQPLTSINPPSAFAQFNEPPESNLLSSSFSCVNLPPSSIQVPLSVSAQGLDPTTAFSPASPNLLSQMSAQSIVPPPSKFTSTSSPGLSQLQPCPLSKPISMPPLSFNEQSQIPIFDPTSASSIFTPTSLQSHKSNINVPPPSFFTPSAIASETALNVQHNVPRGNAAQFPDIAPTEPTKLIPEPPKASGNLSYRMTKKRPQYYSGPIEGVGAISNSNKPMLQPVETSGFPCALFTPSTIQDSAHHIIAAPMADQSSVSGISQVKNVTPFTQFEQSAPPEQSYKSPEYNTAFDLSRETTEYFEQPRQESKSFGIIGSLKSKLSSLDINKIQNSVTTFFDPAYNVAKENVKSDLESIPHGQQFPASTYGEYQQDQGNNFEIFVPNIEQPTQQYSPPYDYQKSHQDLNLLYDQGQNHQQYYQAPDPYTYFQNQDENLPSSSYYSDTTYTNKQQACYTSAKIHAPQPYSTDQANYSYGILENPTDYERAGKIVQHPVITTTHVQDNVYKHDSNVITSITVLPLTLIESKLIGKSINNIPQPELQTLSTEEIGWKMSDLQISENLSENTLDRAFQASASEKKQFEDQNVISLSSQSSSDFLTTSFDQAETKMLGNVFENVTFDPAPGVTMDSQLELNRKLETTSNDEFPQLNVSSAPLCGLSSMLADKTKELTDIENKMKLSPQEFDTIFNRNTNKGFFDKLDTDDSKPLLEDAPDTSDLNICETCREVNKFEEKGTDDLTAQLIENITSPIQLLNPVEVPLTESNTPVEVRDDFDANQCAEISNITEETIETIQVQSATELLENLDEISTNNKNYGWSIDNTPLPTSKVLLDHDYGVQINKISTGFFEKDFSENIPENASDEIKAELKICHEDSPIVLPRQISISSAPLADEDSKSDETGIDVHSIEQDASQDFPIFEEFVIEPSETDDDKIEYQEREKSSEDIREIESFTSRVEKFKKMEETGVDTIHKSLPIFDLATSTSPSSIPIASYFDTGNYAAETHYRNSLISPSNGNAFSVSYLPNPQMRLPPGFEDEFQKRFLDITAQDYARGDVRHDNIPFVPDCSTQTHSTYSPTFSTAQNMPASTNFIIASKITEAEQKGIPRYNLPHFENSAVIMEDKARSPEISSSFVNPATVFKDQIYEKILKEAISLSHLDSNIGAKIEGVDSPLAISFVNPTPVPQERIIEKEIVPVSRLDKRIESEKMPNIFNLFGVAKENAFGEIKPEEPNVLANPPLVPQESSPGNVFKQNVQTLPDHINFFSSNVESTKTSVRNSSADEGGFNRLASYFASPTKKDQTKSFFELSQGQDHYRQEYKPNQNVSHPFGPITDKSSGDTNANNLHKSFFELSQNQNHYIENKNIHNIPQEKYMANLNLMRDLTSYQKEEPNPEQIVRTINYFTVVYDNENLNLNIGEPGSNRKASDNVKYDENIGKTEIMETQILDDDTLKTLIKKCKYCCNINIGYVKNIHNVHHEFLSAKDFPIKKCMDSNNTESKKDTKTSKSIETNTEMDRNSITVSFDNYSIREETNEGVTATIENRSSTEYTPVKHHWFYRFDCEGKNTWRGFSVTDSMALETAYHSPDLSDDTLVPTDGGRFDVNVMGRLRVAVYWADRPCNVRRCSWFYKGTTDARYVPYTEEVAEQLEVEYRHGVTTGEWHRRLVLPNNELVVLHGPAVMVHFIQSAAGSDGFSGATLFAFGKRVYRNAPKITVSKDLPKRIDHLLLLVHGAGECKAQKEKSQSTMRPRVVRRGCDESEIEEIEPSNIDHLLLMCHGVGSACDMRFRSVEEVVDDFRSTSLQLLQSHYRNSYDSGVVGRVEVLPISWHATLHSGETGVDRRLARITLDSIPRLRNFTNDTVLDVLFYTSPVFCQTIINTVCTELNRVYKLFCARNPSFRGRVSLGGHSLGSVILYDLLCHQPPAKSEARQDSAQTSQSDGSKRYVGTAGTGQPSVEYPKLNFSPVALYALGSPIAIFECIRGVESLGEDFMLPTCQNFFNIFHPYDPIAYRIEPLINPLLQHLKPFLIPHHKGRKRMHLELKETMARVGADIKQKLIESIRTTWSSMWQKETPPPERHLERVAEEHMEKEQLNGGDGSKEDLNVDIASPEMLGKLNNGRRIDYVLQEAPFEMINEYLFAMSSHVCYWESEDTMLLILREIYDALGVQPDCTVPQQSMTVQRTKLSKTDSTVAASAAEHPSTSRGNT